MINGTRRQDTLVQSLSVKSQNYILFWRKLTFQKSDKYRSNKSVTKYLNISRPNLSRINFIFIHKGMLSNSTIQKNWKRWENLLIFEGIVSTHETHEMKSISNSRRNFLINLYLLCEKLLCFFSEFLTC